MSIEMNFDELEIFIKEKKILDYGISNEFMNLHKIVGEIESNIFSKHIEKDDLITNISNYIITVFKISGEIKDKFDIENNDKFKIKSIIGYLNDTNDITRITDSIIKMRLNPQTMRFSKILNKDEDGYEEFVKHEKHLLNDTIRTVRKTIDYIYNDYQKETSVIVFRMIELLNVILNLLFGIIQSEYFVKFENDSIYIKIIEILNNKKILNNTNN